MSILTPISRGCQRTLTDGSVRYVIEFGPLDAVAAATLFGMPGTEMGVVALKDGRALNAHSGDEKDGSSPNDMALHDEPISEMIERLDVLARADLGMTPHGQQSAGLGHGEDRTCTSDAALPMANDQLVDANKTKHITLANYAGIFCADPKFWEWIGTKTDKPNNAEEAAGYIRRQCVVTSRAQIDHSQNATEKFRQIMRDFDEWKARL